MCGWYRISRTPSTAIVANQTSITQPNMPPTRAVPKRWSANSAVMMTKLIGTTAFASAGTANCTPSTAPSTEIAGVMMPSP